MKRIFTENLYQFRFFFGGVYKPHSKYKTNTFIVLETITFGTGDKHVCASGKVIATHLRNQGVAFMLSYSPPRMVHPQVIYAIAFSAQLNSLQVDLVDREVDE